MKKLIIAILFFSAFYSQFSQAQTGNIYANFDDVDAAFTTFSGATFQKVANPSATGINTSAFVGQVTSSTASTYEGIYNSVLYTKMDLSTMHTFKMKVYSPRIGNVVLKLENSLNKTVDYVSVTVATTKVSEWEELYFDLPKAKTNLYDRIVLSFDFGDNTHNLEKWYFDDVTLIAPPGITKVTLPNVFSSNMVLQQDMLTSLWGWAPANESVEITGSWGRTVTVKAGADKKWTAKIQTPKAVSGQAPQYTLTFKGASNTVVLSNILIGDVWICSGQSNMEFTMTPNLPWTRGVLNYTSEIAAATYPNIRLFKVPRNSQPLVVDNCEATWLECNPTNVATFSGVAYYFGRELYLNSNINIPIGMLLTAYGGSSCQAWASREALAGDAELNTKILIPYDAAPTTPTPELRATNLFNGMVAPLIPFGIKGALWYQGESNASNGTFYTKLCGAMIQDWRTKWGLGNFPFYFAQLPVYTDPNWPAFRDAQTNMLTFPNTGMAVTIDLIDPDPTNIHPINKVEIGQRLARWAMAKSYGQEITYSGPVYKSSIAQNGKMIISFHPTTIGTGLQSRGGAALTEFKIAGADKVFYPAVATIEGNTVVVSSTSVSSPTIVAYAYSASPVPNFTNKEGLPAAPFRTDLWNNDILFSGIVTAVDSPKFDDEIIFPNPVKDFLVVGCGKAIKSIDIFDISGKKIFLTMSRNESKMILNVQKLQTGIYFFKVKQIDGQDSNRKFFKI